MHFVGRERIARMDKLYSAVGAGELLSVSHWTISSWIAKGKLTRIKVGGSTKVRESELLAMIKPETAADSAARNISAEQRKRA